MGVWVDGAKLGKIIFEVAFIFLYIYSWTIWIPWSILHFKFSHLAISLWRQSFANPKSCKSCQISDFLFVCFEHLKRAIRTALVPAAEIRDHETGLVSGPFSWFQSRQKFHETHETKANPILFYLSIFRYVLIIYTRNMVL